MASFSRRKYFNSEGRGCDKKRYSGTDFIILKNIIINSISLWRIMQEHEDITGEAYVFTDGVYVFSVE